MIVLILVSISSTLLDIKLLIAALALLACAASALAHPLFFILFITSVALFLTLFNVKFSFILSTLVTNPS